MISDSVIVFKLIFISFVSLFINLSTKESDILVRNSTNHLLFSAPMMINNIIESNAPLIPFIKNGSDILKTHRTVLFLLLIYLILKT